MQRANGGVGVPSAFAAVAFEDLGQCIGVFGQVFQRDSAVFDEAHRLAVALQAHHDVEAGFAHFPEVFLRCVFSHFDHRAGQAELAHELDQLANFRQQVGLGCA